MKNYLKGLTNLFTAATVTVTLMLVLPPYAFDAFADALPPLADRTVEILVSNEQAISLPMGETNPDLCLQARRPTVLLAAADDNNGDDDDDNEKKGEDTEIKDEGTSEPRFWDTPRLG